MHKGVVAAHIELRQPHRVGSGRRDGLQRSAAGGKHVGNTEGLRRRGDGGAAARPEQKERTGRRQEQRQAQAPPELLDRGIHVADVARHARPQRDAIERQPVASQGRLGLGPADQGVPCILGQVLLTLADDLVQALELAHAAGAAGIGAFVPVHVLTRSVKSDGGAAVIDGPSGNINHKCIHPFQPRDGIEDCDQALSVAERQHQMRSDDVGDPSGGRGFALSPLNCETLKARPLARPAASMQNGRLFAGRRQKIIASARIKPRP